VPLCFAYDGAHIYTTTDAKPKSTQGRLLKRVRNILENPQVSVLIDHYEEDWDKLYYVLVLGKAVVLEKGNERGRALTLLSDKYPQYKHMDLAEEAVLRITPRRVRSWGRLPDA
jgi:PPOX class probable F420-dependent enzyme